MVKGTWFRTFALVALLGFGLVLTCGPALAGSWTQVNKNGFVNNYGPTTEGSRLFVFDGALYAYNENGLFRMETSPCVRWARIVLPSGMKDASFAVVNTILYASDASQSLYQVRPGETLNSFTAGWQPVVSAFEPLGVAFLGHGPRPMGYFQGKVYAMYYPSTGQAFEIYRSAHSGKQSMLWERVVENGFNDSKNRNLAFILEFNNKVIVGTTSTRAGSWMNWAAFSSGVDIWESATGNYGSWTKVNQSGFGTETSAVGSSTMFRTNQDIGCAAVYNGHLYVGTDSNWGSEVWRYDGTGLSGWTNVTPYWVTTSRNRSMVVFEGDLYLAEVWGTGNLWRYNGTTWTIEKSGPHPFSSQNGGIRSLAVFTVGSPKLFAATERDIYGTTHGEQVWATPDFTANFCMEFYELPELRFDPPRIRYLVPSEVELTVRFRNFGDPLEFPTVADIYQEEELIWRQDVGPLGHDESVEFSFPANLMSGPNHFRLVIDPENLVQEFDKENNHFGFMLEGPVD